jgi:CheY-like chemotaxis protein
MVEERTEHPVFNSAAFAVRYTATPRRVLVVEDDLDSVRALVELIRDIGHRVEYAINGYAALEIARRFKPHFVLMDLGLPGMSGYEACRRLKREPGAEPMRVIALTAYGQEEHRAQARSAGCELHLVKPVSPQAIFDVLESTLPS